MMNNIKPAGNQNMEGYLLRNQKNASEEANPSPKVKAAENPDSIETKNLKKQGKIECQTCKNRKYQDGSDDPGVSFKAPGHIAPEASAATVMSHEMEHVSNEQSKARNEKKEILSQNVQIYTAICPECGKTFVAGGKTTTVSRGKQSTDAKEPNKGEKFDIKI